MTLINPDEAKSPETKPKNPEGNSQWGYDLYPERRVRTVTTGLPALLEGKGRENIDKIHCERNVYKCIKQSPLIKLMIAALKSSGCTVDIRRHISCEECAPSVSGGFDPILNQVVVCQNVVQKEGLTQAVLTHEFVHMFDYCRNHLDFKNLDHLACTEVRAANLAHCSFLSAWIQGDVSVFDFKERHRDCVRSKALSSVLTARDVTQSEAEGAVDRVFDRCYADLEPIGRRLRRNSDDMYKAYAEGYYYGYSDDTS